MGEIHTTPGTKETQLKDNIIKEKSAGLILYRTRKNKREYLLLLYSSKKTYWGLSKGHLESNETEEEAALREANEETSLTKITILKGFETTMRYFMIHETKRISKEVVFFLGRVDDDDDGKISKEHKGLCWLSFEKAHAQLRYKKDKNVLRRAEEFLLGVNLS